MPVIPEAFTFPVGFVSGAVVAWFLLRNRSSVEGGATHVAEVHAALREESMRRAVAESSLARERAVLMEERAFVEHAQKQLVDTFQALSAQSLEKNTRSFLDLAKHSLERYQETAQGDLEHRQQAITQMVKPLKDVVANVDDQFRRIEKERAGSYERLLSQVRSLEGVTGQLAGAMRAPKARGRWGEIQLKRVVEFAGMLDRCDFTEQTSIHTDDGRRQPDMIINLAGGRTIVVDAKTPMDSYMDAMAADDPEVRARRFGEHAARVRKHVNELSDKRYWRQFDSSPVMVVLFMPGEDLLSAALEHDPSLIEVGTQKKVLLATPTTLIATLLGVAHGWREERLTENATKICDLGRELYERTAVIADKWSKMGRSLDGAVTSYNEAVSSIESRFLVTARKLKALEIATDKDVVELTPVAQTVSRASAGEFANQRAEADGLSLDGDALTPAMMAMDSDV